ncbi:hypothetical protein PV326_012193 [Microctonus aethiopoides]|nr:hypothetical protein PV326_012193 [Microctonus aethiopoides]
MSKCGFGEFDKARQRNQFTRHERDHLLCIMSEFSEKLEDKNLSILARKEIWTTIDRKFRNGGFTDRTTAQLKKYWQNYKYHNGRNKWKKENAAMEMEYLKKSSKIHDNLDDSISQLVIESHIDASDDSEAVENTEQFQDKSEMPLDLIKQPAVIISETDVSGSSVTVSVIHSKSVKRKNIFDGKNDQSNNEIDKVINNEIKMMNPMKKLKSKCLLLQPRKSNKNELLSEINKNNDKQSAIKNIDNCISSNKFLNSPKKNLDDHDEHLIRNDRTFLPYVPSNSYPGQFNLPINYENHPDCQSNNFQYQNLHVIRQMQLLRHLEAEEHRLKVKLAEMSLKETHLKILHLREECESTQMKFKT